MASLVCAPFFLLIAGVFTVAAADAPPWSQYQGGPTHVGSADGPSVPLKPAWPKPFAITPGGPDHNYGVSAPVFAGDEVVCVGPTAVYEVNASDGTLKRTIPRTFGPSVPAAVADISGKSVLLFTQGFGEGPGTHGASATPGVPSSVAGSPTPIVSATATTAGGSAATPSASPVGGVGSASTAPELVAVDAATGRPVWKSPVELGTVSRTGVSVEGSTAYVGDNSGTVYAVDISTGKVLWTHELNGYLETPIASDGSVVVATTQWNVSARRGATAVAMDPATGDQVWIHQESGGGVAAPMIDGGSVMVAFGEGRILALQASDGSVVWDRDLKAPLSQFESAVANDGVVAVADARGRISGFDESSGESLWTFATNETLLRGSPLITGGDILAGTRSGQLVAVDLHSGRLVFKTVASGGGYRDMAAAAGTLVATKSGVHPGLVAFISDPSGTLLSVQSPTVFVPGKMLLSFAEAAIPIALIVLMLGRPLLARMGPVEFEDDDSDDASPSDVEDPS